MVHDDIKAISEHIDRVFSHLMQRSFFRFRCIERWSPPINCYETKSAYYVCVELAGIDPKQIDLKVENNTLILQGTRPALSPPTKETVRIHALEIDHGGFYRIINIPQNVDANKIEANYKKGILWIKLPKYTTDE